MAGVTDEKTLSSAVSPDWTSSSDTIDISLIRMFSAGPMFFVENRKSDLFLASDIFWRRIYFWHRIYF